MSHRPIRKLILAATAVAIVGGGLSACTGHANGSNGGGGGAKSSSVLTIQGDAGNPTLVKNFNPFSTTELGGTRLLYEPLEIPNTIDGTYTPFLATSFKLTDSKTLVYTIRQHVKWSDGKAFTPSDVVFTYNLLKKYPALDTTGVWSVVKSVATTGDTVTFTFKQPNVPFANTVAQVPIVPEHIWSKISNPAKDVNANPIGTGPFTLEKFADTQYQLKKNPTYWQADKIVPKTVLYPAQSTNQTTNQLDVTSGKFDWSYNFLPDVKKTYVDKAPKTNSYWFPPGGTIGLFMNLTKAPYNDVNFRKGISDALNRSTIATKAVNGYTTQASQSGLILPNLKKYLDPSLPKSGNVTQNATAARQAFAAAGYQSKGGKLIKGGKQASMTIVLPSNYSDWVAAATEVKTELGAIGIKVTLDLPQAAQYTQQISSGSFDAAFGGFGGTGDVYKDFNTALNSSFAAAVGTPTASNFERFKNPAADQALATLASATDSSAQMTAAHKLQQVMYGQVPIIALYYGGSWGLFRTNHFTGWPSASDPYTLPTPYNNAVLLVLTHLKAA